MLAAAGIEETVQTCGWCFACTKITPVWTNDIGESGQPIGNFSRLTLCNASAYIRARTCTCDEARGLEGGNEHVSPFALTPAKTWPNLLSVYRELLGEWESERSNVFKFVSPIFIYPFVRTEKILVKASRQCQRWSIAFRSPYTVRRDSFASAQLRSNVYARWFLKKTLLRFVAGRCSVRLSSP